MTDIDTAAIRAEWYAGMNIMDAKDCIRALCDALDAALAEASGWKMCANHRGELLTEALRRFDAALVLCDERDQPGIVDVDYDEQTEAFRRALIEGTTP